MNFVEIAKTFLTEYLAALFYIIQGLKMPTTTISHWVLQPLRLAIHAIINLRKAESTNIDSNAIAILVLISGGSRISHEVPVNLMIFHQFLMAAIAIFETKVGPRASTINLHHILDPITWI